MPDLSPKAPSVIIVTQELVWQESHTAMCQGAPLLHQASPAPTTAGGISEHSAPGRIGPVLIKGCDVITDRLLNCY